MVQAQWVPAYDSARQQEGQGFVQEAWFHKNMGDEAEAQSRAQLNRHGFRVLSVIVFVSQDRVQWLVVR
jgi:hypothetical protein